ncbi:MAG: DUF2842 domain-containing protein [Hyphomicrobiales bacterium]
MTTRQRKFLGVIATVVFLVIYCLVAMAVTGDFVAGRGPVIELVGFLIAGIAWLPVVMAIIRWMSPKD